MCALLYNAPSLACVSTQISIKLSQFGELSRGDGARVLGDVLSTALFGNAPLKESFQVFAGDRPSQRLGFERALTCKSLLVF